MELTLSVQKSKELHLDQHKNLDQQSNRTAYFFDHLELYGAVMLRDLGFILDAKLYFKDRCETMTKRLIALVTAFSDLCRQALWPIWFSFKPYVILFQALCETHTGVQHHYI